MASQSLFFVSSPSFAARLTRTAIGQSCNRNFGGIAASSVFERTRPKAWSVQSLQLRGLAVSPPSQLQPPSLSSWSKKKDTTAMVNQAACSVGDDHHEKLGGGGVNAVSANKDDVDEEEMEQEDMFVEPHATFQFQVREWGGPRRGGRYLEPTRYGDWEKKGRCSDF